ISN
ncbi:conserved membrane domain protein, partial [Chlamydia psittaci 84-8471/1]